MQQSYYYNPTMPRYNSMPQQNYAAPTPTLRGRPVSSLEEVRAAAVDFDGVVTFFPDIANGYIYTKQCNADGTASLNVYELKATPSASSAASTEDFVTKEEFNKALKAIQDAFNSMTKIDNSNNQTSSNNVNNSSASNKPLQEFTFN